MSKLYVISIGGSGTRVLKALTMLLAAGMKSEAEEIIPLVIDTDVHNGDLEYFRKLIKCYRQINQSFYRSMPSEIYPHGFFRTQIHTPKELNISGSQYGTLGEMINYLSLNASGMGDMKNLTDLLFSTSSRELRLEHGFLGVPSIGSVVLRDVVESKGFKEFTQNFQPGDRIFIVSSIFGGTGAAGFPLLLNIFRDPQSGISNAAYINNAIIGGISLQPYYDVDVDKFNKGESPIDSNTFITKTKAALSYYEKYLAQNLNAMFFIGESRKSNYPNNPGGKEQRNPACFLELAAALSILKFMNYEKNAANKEQLDNNLKFFEFGISEDEVNLNLSHLGKTKDEIIRQLISFHYLATYMSLKFDNAVEDRHMVWKNDLKMPANFNNSEIAKGFREFFDLHYYQWLLQMGKSDHGRRFLPYNLRSRDSEEALLDFNKSVKMEVNDSEWFQLVNEIPAKKDSGWLNMSKDKIDLDEIFNASVIKVIENERLQNFESRLIGLFNEGMSEFYTKRFLN